MDAISIGVGRSVSITQAGAQQVTNIPGVVELTITGTNISVNGTTNAYVRAAGWSGFNAGDIVDVATFTTGANNGRKRVSSVTATDLLVTDTGLTTEAAGASATLSKVRLPTELYVIATTVIPKFGLWHCDGGTPPVAAAAIFVGPNQPLRVSCSGYTIFTTDGASGSISVTPLENA